MYTWFLILINILLLLMKIELFIVIPLFTIIIHEKLLQNVIKSITYHKYLLGIILVNLVIITFLFTVFAYVFLHHTFYTYDIDQGESMCSTLVQCFTYVFALGPRSFGSIGDVIIRQSYDSDNRFYYYLRILYDNLIFYVVNIFSLKILFGCIIETFADLRKKKNQEDMERNNFCFICNLEKYLFLKNSLGFEYHYTQEHNLWYYIFFLYNLKQKKITEMNGIESYIHNKIDTDDITWLPIRRALNLEVPEPHHENL